LLVQTIARKAKIPKLDSFDKEKVLSVELELNLMYNGAVVGAKITKSSGNDGLDQRVYRAALAASPYPEPPSSPAKQQRFRVEVKYTF
jgi:protein TonB